MPHNQYINSRGDFRVRIKRICKICGTEFTCRPSAIKRGGGVYCTRQCLDKSRSLKPIETRFWEKVNKNGPVLRQEIGNCWIWNGATCKRYGILASRSGLWVLSHRLSWEIHNGSIPSGMGVLHRCDNPPCVRPNHLFLGTSKDNACDMARKGRWRSPQGKPQIQASQVLEIKRLYGTGVPVKEIAAIYERHTSRIYALLST
jgi:hypothetical protein